MPPPFVAAVCVLVLRDDRVLALRRSAAKDVGAGLWETLSGRIEVGEEPRAAARREALEESGLDVEVEARPWTAYQTLRGDAPMLVVVYRARPVSGSLRISGEHDAYAWVDGDGFAALSPLTQLVAAVRDALAEVGQTPPIAASRREPDRAPRPHVTRPAPEGPRRIERTTFFARLRELALPPGDWVVHGSGSMLAHELVEDAGDIDVVARGAAWDAAAARGEVSQEHWDRKVTLPGKVDVFDGWGPFEAAALIDAAVCIDGVPCARLCDVLASKRWLARPKDRAHVELLERVVDVRNPSAR